MNKVEVIANPLVFNDAIRFKVFQPNLQKNSKIDICDDNFG